MTGPMGDNPADPFRLACCPSCLADLAPGAEVTATTPCAQCGYIALSPGRAARKPVTEPPSLTILTQTQAQEAPPATRLSA